MTARNLHAVSPTLGAAILCASLAAAIATSCWHPTFDPMLSASEITVRKLGEPTMYFTAETYESYGLENAWFLPPMVDLPTSGSLVLDMGTRLGFKQIWVDAFNHSGSFNTTSGFETGNAFGESYLAYSAPSGAVGAVIISNIISGQYLDWATNPAVTVPSTLGPFGIGAVAQAVPSLASLACFVYALGVPQYTILAWGGGAPAFAAPAPFFFADALQVAVPGKFLAATSYLYLSCGLSDGSRAIYRWSPPFTAAEPTRFPENYGPLIGALSDGRLLAERDGIISVLDPDLNRLFKFPAGSLRFVHERYDNTDVPPSMKVVFTRTMFVRESNYDDQGTIRAEVYEIPTASLEDLAE